MAKKIKQLDTGTEYLGEADKLHRALPVHENKPDFNLPILTFLSSFL